MKMKLLNRLQVLERMMLERNTPGQEQLIAAYLRDILVRDASSEILTSNYEKVKEFVPKMH